MFGIRSRLIRLWLAGPAERQHTATLRTLRESRRPVRKILFLCYGNICRSPVAERVAQRLMPGMEVISAGFYPTERRNTPAQVQAAARSIGVDLSAWSSRRVTQEMVRSADLLVISDLYNFRQLRREFPESQHKVLFLGLFLDPPQLAIADPYNKSDKETLRIVRLIEAAVSAFARQIVG
jgi:protein-tyrosine phosphatase